ncbi:DUF6157 family protein [Niveispirillum sp. KHB5.9]|uniref:DUF6157 family protein n=1 Tax=Niveispirillum sp. KHB5.9 TaxID=3400269 RepID=UPI003A8B7D53
MHSTNYHNTLITVSADCPVSVGTPPAKPGTIAERQFALLAQNPYQLTSDALLLAVENERKQPVTAETFFAKPQACLRASPLVKKQGYGLHHDAEGCVALVPVESETYANLLADASVIKRPGMRSARG